jgi:gliding motility-associated-like protein
MKKHLPLKSLVAVSAAALMCVSQVNVLQAQMVGSNAYIKGTSVEIGLDGNGGFEGANYLTSPVITGMHTRTGTSFFGFVANPAVDGWTNYDGDFFTPGTPENGWGLEIGASGAKAASNCYSDFSVPNNISGALTAWSHTFDCYSADWQGNMTTGGTNLHIKINYFLQEFDLFYTTTVSITNNTSATIPEIYYYRNVDPDNNQTLSGSYTTTNTVVSQPTGSCGLAHVKAIQTSPWNSYMGFAGAGANFRVCRGGFSNRDASDIWNGSGTLAGGGTVGATVTSDEAVAIAYKIQNLAPGATETFKFVVILDDASAANAINNLLYFTYIGSGTTPPSTCSPFIDTVRTCGNPVNIGISGSIVSEFNWTWTPTAGLSDSVGPAVAAFPGSTTTYSVTGTPINPACFTPVTMAVVVEVTPSAGSNPQITYTPPVCVSDPPFNFTVDSLGGAWSGTGITNSTTGAFDPSVSGPGTYLITYITPGICNTTDTALITVSPIADPTITAVPPICVGAPPITLTAADTGGVWSGTGITDSLAGTFNPGLATVGSYVVTYTISNGLCSATDTMTITVVNNFDSTITAVPPMCIGSTPLTLIAATSGGTWTGTNITSASGGTFNPTVAGDIVVTYTISGSCGSSDTVHILVVPYADATITAPGPVCVGSPAFNMTAAQTGGTWSGTGITSPSAGTFNPTTSGTFTITYTISGMCGDTDNQSVTVNPIPTPAFSSLITSGCVPLCVQFNETPSTSCSSVTYDFGDGTTGSSFDPLHCFNTAGQFSVTITCTDGNNCTGTTTVSNYITAYEVPVANFTMNPNSFAEPGQAVTFTDVSTGGGSSFWNFGDPGSGVDSIDSGSPASHIFAEEGYYCITLVANNNGCVDTAKNCIVVIGDATLFIPNVFTPNGDNDNDVWYITTTGVKELTCEIYDRWGLKIATFDGTTSGWDGKTKSGALSADGTYYYVVHVTAFNNKLTEKAGYLQLLRAK